LVKVMKLPFLAGLVLAAIFVSACVFGTPSPDPTQAPDGGQSTTVAATETAATTPAANASTEVAPTSVATESSGSTSQPSPTSSAGAISPAPAAPTPTPSVVNLDGREVKQYGAPPLMTIDPSANYTATIRTSQGPVSVELFASQAPNTVNSFIFLAREGFYNGIIFHRVIQQFMIQGGDPAGLGTGGPGYQYGDEIDPILRFEQPGVLAMANRGVGTVTNGSQFFITVAPTPHLKGNHTIFGRVTSGQDVANAISLVRTGQGDRPVTPVVIQSIDILKNGS
jgi:cyclophilin family peptidyl-prolyl cis-trans isomerase